jgi:transposase
VNTSAVQHEGLKYSDDRHDAFWRAHLIQLGIPPTGHIHPRTSCSSRSGSQAHAAGPATDGEPPQYSKLAQTNEGVRMTTNQIKAQTVKTIADSVSDPNRAMALRSTQAIILALDEQISQIERAVMRHVRPDPRWSLLQTVWGIGPILAPTIRLESGEVGRFGEVGNYVSYCRCVKSERTTMDEAGASSIRDAVCPPTPKRFPGLTQTPNGRPLRGRWIIA